MFHSPIERTYGEVPMPTRNHRKNPYFLVDWTKKKKKKADWKQPRYGRKP